MKRISPKIRPGVPPVLCAVAGLVLTACSGIDVEQEHHKTVSYGVSTPVRKLVVKGRTGDIHVTGGGGGTVSVTETQDYRNAPPHTTHATSGSTLTLTYDCSDCGVSYDVHVPAGTAVDVTDDTGSVTLSGLGGPVQASTGTGDVTADGLTSSQARLTAETGDVHAGFDASPATVYATADTGNVGVTVPQGGAYAVDAVADTGDVRVNVTTAGDSAHSITAHAGTGDVTVGAA
ncbi:DUF4097 domain-containing protein [Streptomyces sp. RB6PN25]|uniref:DUF4097 domain-containing protein n=1 Tax=Streptomyces humicola TaxID=2953240 RepID=A0ABT1PUM3_9ACTN|nr:DUF4097 family beta strand repeat-containing protein [Streptomyces humicola]MCQ4081357.1 DUF4097 domain-containing protein [Streptomyces humicola]